MYLVMSHSSELDPFIKEMECLTWVKGKKLTPHGVIFPSLYPINIFIINSNPREAEAVLKAHPISYAEFDLYLYLSDLEDGYHFLSTYNPIITYGFNRKASVTISAVSEMLIISIQRSLPTILNTAVEQQEIPIGLDVEETMARVVSVICGLILGMSPLYMQNIFLSPFETH